MGTRALTIVVDEDDSPLVALYRQFDGYPEGHGKELEAFLKDTEIINGIPIGTDKDLSKCFNGMGCLAASLVSYFKNGIGGFYCATPDINNREEYTYIISPKKKGKKIVPHIKIIE